MSGSAAGRPTGLGGGCWPTRKRNRMRSGGSTGTSWRTPPWCAPTSTPPVREPQRGTRRLRRHRCRARPGVGTQSRRAVDQGPPGLRRRWPAVADAADRRAAAREHPAGAAAGFDLGATAGWAGPAPQAPDHLVADRGYSYPPCRRLLRRRGIAHTIPERSDQQATRARRVPGVAGRRWWIRCATGSATSWSGASPGSSSIGPSPPGATSWRSATTPGWSWALCSSGSYEPSDWCQWSRRRLGDQPTGWPASRPANRAMSCQVCSGFSSCVKWPASGTTACST
jgi:hypothetical protein